MFLLKFVDTALDIGVGLIGPKTGVNYVSVIIFGFLLPCLTTSILFFAKDKSRNTKEIKKLTASPLIGIIDKKNKLIQIICF